MKSDNSISIQGYRGSFHHIVALQEFGKNIKLLERDTFERVFQDVEEEKAEYGIAAFQNSIAGTIQETTYCLEKFQPKILKTVSIPIEHHLIGRPESKIDQIQMVLSHPMAIRQCLPYLTQHNWNVIETEDTAGSVKQIMKKGSKNIAAISSQLSAEIYRAKILESSIQSKKDNRTSFYIFQKSEHRK